MTNANIEKRIGALNKTTKTMVALGLSALLALLVPARADAARYVVREGDTLQGLAETYLGSYTRWPEIVYLNPHLRSQTLVPGTVIEMPVRELVELERPQPTPWSLPQSSATPPVVASPFAIASPLASPFFTPSAAPSASPTLRWSPRPQPTPSPRPTASVTPLRPITPLSPLHGHYALSFQPWQYSESLQGEKISASGTVGRSLFTQLLVRPVSFLLLDASYSFSYYQISRVSTGEQATRQQDFVRLGVLGVFELVPRYLDWAIGVGGEWENFTVFLPSTGVSEVRVNDMFDLPHHSFGGSLRTRLAARPFAPFPLGLWLELGLSPFIAVQQKEVVLPTSLWGVDGQAGVEAGLGPVYAQAAFFARQQMGTGYTYGVLGGRFGLGVSF